LVLFFLIFSQVEFFEFLFSFFSGLFSLFLHPWWNIIGFCFFFLPGVFYLCSAMVKFREVCFPFSSARFSFFSNLLNFFGFCFPSFLGTFFVFQHGYIIISYCQKGELSALDLILQVQQRQAKD
jgi:hypothetical protein